MWERGLKGPRAPGTKRPRTVQSAAIHAENHERTWRRTVPSTACGFEISSNLNCSKTTPFERSGRRKFCFPVPPEPASSSSKGSPLPSPLSSVGEKRPGPSERGPKGPVHPRRQRDRCASPSAMRQCILRDLRRLLTELGAGGAARQAHRPLLTTTRGSLRERLARGATLMFTRRCRADRPSFTTAPSSERDVRKRPSTRIDRHRSPAAPAAASSSVVRTRASTTTSS